MSEITVNVSSSPAVGQIQKRNLSWPEIEHPGLIIIFLTLFYLAFMYPQYWLFKPYFELFRHGWLENSLFNGLNDKERYVFFFRIVSFVSSVGLSAILLKISGLFPSKNVRGWIKEIFTREAFGFIALTSIFMLLFSNGGSGESTTRYISDLNFFMTHIVSLSICGPFFEELFWRLILFAFLRKRIGFIFSSSLTSVVFSLTHFNHPAIYLFELFGFGFIMAWAYERTKNPFLPIVLHMISNLIVAITSLFS